MQVIQNRWNQNIISVLRYPTRYECAFEQHVRDEQSKSLPRKTSKNNSSGVMGKVIMQVETLSIKRLALRCEWEESTSHRGQSLHNGVRIEQGNFNYSMDDVTDVWGNCCQSKQLGSSVCLWRHTTRHDTGWSLLATLVVFEGLFSPTVTIHINIMCMNDWNVHVVRGAVFSQTSYHTYQR